MNRELKTGMAVVLMAASTAYAKPIKTDDLSNMIIQGQNRLRVSAPEIKSPFTPDIFRDFGTQLRDESVMNTLKTPAVSEPTVLYPFRAVSQKTASPWLQSIYESPILTLNVKKSQDDKKVEWAFIIKDSRGKVFYEEKKKGVMPESLRWEGFGSNGNPLTVGDDYSYSLSIIDEAGNPQRYTGKPFSIKAFRYARGGRTVTALTPTMLFGDDSAIKISKNGEKVLLEVRDALRPVYARKIEVVTYETDPKFAQARSNAIAKFLVNALEYDEHQVEAKGLVTDGQKGYHHVEINVK